MRVLRCFCVCGVFCAVLGMGVGCGTVRPTNTVTPLDAATVEIPEAQFLDVGIATLEVKGGALKSTKKFDAQAQIKQAEKYYIPVHLKRTLQESGQWGSVRVLPVDSEAVDLRVSGSIYESNGVKLKLDVRAVDAMGRVWLDKYYVAKADDKTYETSEQGSEDPFQDVYNRIANDLVRARKGYGEADLVRIRETSALTYAADLAPAAFGDHVERRRKGGARIMRLPAPGDLMYERLMTIREREYMLLDTVNQHYAIFYDQMWNSYKKWRLFDRTETLAMNKIKRQSWLRGGLGVLLIAGAVVLEANSGGAWDSGVLRDLMVIGGVEMVSSGLNVSKEARMHAAALEELGESFSAEIRPVIVQVEGETVRLTGTAEEQYVKWRDLLDRLYVQETGFNVDGTLSEGVMRSGVR